MQAKDIASAFFNEIKEIQSSFENECNIWKQNTKKCKLIILGEAPLTSDKYFYNKPGNYLSFLKNHYKFQPNKGTSWKDFLRDKGILNVDLYKFPLPSEFYNNDNNFYLYDEKHVKSIFNNLKKMKLVDEDTKYMYRYPKLIKRGLPTQKPMVNFSNHYDLQAIGIGKNAGVLNPQLKGDLP